LWDGFDPQAMLRDRSLGWYDEDDFVNPPNIPANTAITATLSRYKALTTNNTGCQIVDAGIQGGAVSLENAATAGDNDESYLQAGRAHVLATAPEDDTWPYHHVQRVRFECRFALNSVADNVNAIFIGLGGQALATGALADNTGALVSTFHGIGAQILHADGNSINVVHQENGSALQTTISGMAAPVAETWYRFGMDFNPTANNKNEIVTFYWNGVKQSTYLTEANVAAATFPKSTDSVQILVGPTFLHKAGSDAVGKLILSGWRCAGEITSAAGNEACA
jgi:hypothetical protein